jgi:hypothetical protein
MSVVAFPARPHPVSAPPRDRPATVTWIFSAPSTRRAARYWQSVPNGPGAPRDHPCGGQFRLPGIAIAVFWGLVLWAVLR